MDWFQQVNNYCERTDFSYWSEPINAVTNGAFIIAALIAWHIAKGDRGGRGLAVILFLIGVGSYLFHTHATQWALLADVLPIMMFIMAYLLLATVRFFALPWWAGVIAMFAFVPYSILVGRILEPMTGDLNGSLGYVPVPILISIYGLLLLKSRPKTARGLLIGAGILVVSLTFRTLDKSLCAAFPIGTHFAWHILNGVMLGWMIRVLVRDRRRYTGREHLPGHLT